MDIIMCIMYLPTRNNNNTTRNDNKTTDNNADRIPVTDRWSVATTTEDM